jgi:hypothetical protein
MPMAALWPEEVMTLSLALMEALPITNRQTGEIFHQPGAGG